ncbi:MAG: dicarboxylate/amino acid:cation symporter [Anaplasma sp.]
MQGASFIVRLMPLAVWAFLTNFLYNVAQGQNFSSGLIKYVVCVIVANAVQAVIVLPLLVRAHGVSVLSTLVGMAPALITASLSRSSTATLPITMDCMERKLKVPKKLASFVLPLCASVNMNACASFILITVLFVCEVNGYIFSVGEMLVWILFTVGGAIGNAAVPMGCYFMTMNFLILLKMPLHVMGLILPIYTLIDMLATPINIWSDACITRIMAKKFGDGDDRK